MLIVIEHYDQLEKIAEELNLQKIPNQFKEYFYHSNFKEFSYFGHQDNNPIFLICGGYGKTFSLALSDYLNVMDKKDEIGLKNNKYDNHVFGIGCYSPSQFIDKNLIIGECVIPNAFISFLPNKNNLYKYIPNSKESLLLKKEFENNNHRVNTGNATSFDDVVFTEKSTPVNHQWYLGWREFAQEESTHLNISWADYSSYYLAESSSISNMKYIGCGFIRESYEKGENSISNEIKTKFYLDFCKALKQLLKKGV